MKTIDVPSRRYNGPMFAERIWRPALLALVLPFVAIGSLVYFIAMMILPGRMGQRRTGPLSFGPIRRVVPSKATGMTSGMLSVQNDKEIKPQPNGPPSGKTSDGNPRETRRRFLAAVARCNRARDITHIVSTEPALAIADRRANAALFDRLTQLAVNDREFHGCVTAMGLTWLSETSKPENKDQRRIIYEMRCRRWTLDGLLARTTMRITAVFDGRNRLQTAQVWRPKK